MKSRYIAHALFSVAVLLAIGLSSCSYVADYVEGKITNRASFSIEATYNSATKKVTITWDEQGDSSHFPGFEIYMTDTVNDEYAGYVIVGGRFSGTGPAGLYQQNSSLANYYTNAFVYDAANVYNNSVSNYEKLGPGRYFFRVGILAWDESEEKERVENYAGGALWETGAYLESNYNSHTDLDAISGYAMVEIQ